MSEHRSVTTEDLVREPQDRGRTDEPESSDTPEPREPMTDEFPAQHEPESMATEEPETTEATATRQETTGPQRTALFENEDADRFQESWRGLQSDFVDDPRAAVQQADELVAEVMQTLAANFAERKRSLEEQWSRGEDVQTEELRISLQQYRAFFQQLLAI